MGALTEYPDLIQGTDQWHEVRRGIVTASTVGKLLTPTRKVAANDTARSLTRLLVAERITGRTVLTYRSDAMMRGVMDEPLARDLYARTYQGVREVGFMTRELGAGAVLGYSPDGLVADDGLIEVKSAEPKIHLARILADEVPAEHIAQCQAGLLVSGRHWCDYLSYCGGMPMWRKRVEPDPEWRAAIEAAVLAFEAAAAEMVAAYTEAVEGLPATEYIEHFPEIEV